MMTTPGKRALGQVLKAAFGQKENKVTPIPAMMGRYNEAGEQEIAVPNHPDFVWVRMRGHTSEVVRAFNETTGLDFGEPILVVRDALDPRYYRVLRRDTGKYQDWTNTDGGVFTVKPHGKQHSFGDPAAGGYDPVWVFKRQIMQPLLCHPTTPYSMRTKVEPDYYFWANEFRYFPGSLSPDITTYIPSTGHVRFVLVYLDGNTGTVQLLAGDEFTLIFTSDVVAMIPELLPSQGFPLAAAYLNDSTSRIDWVNLFDLRVMLFTGYGSLPGPHGLDPDDGFHTGQLKAAHVSVADANNVFTGATSEDVLYELFKREAWFDWSHFI